MFCVFLLAFHSRRMAQTCLYNLKTKQMQNNTAHPFSLITLAASQIRKNFNITIKHIQEVKNCPSHTIYVYDMHNFHQLVLCTAALYFTHVFLPFVQRKKNKGTKGE